jgi:GNAT superfamily N-acetyltransferase
MGRRGVGDPRPYESRDAEAVSALIRRTIRITNSADYAMDRLERLIEYFTPSRIDELNQERYCVVVDRDGEIVGTAGLEGNELVTFFVAPDLQREGIGSALLRQVEQFARTSGIAELHVGSSLAGAPFYEARGYRPTGEVSEGTAGPHIEMRKTLPPIQDVTGNEDR